MAANKTVQVFGRINPTYPEQLPISHRKEVYGLAFPLGKNNVVGGYFKKTSGIEMIKNAVRQLLKTERGERVMLPNFGCSLRKFLFQPLDSQLFAEIKEEIQTSFKNYIVGAKIVKLSVFPYEESGPAGGNSLRIILNLKLDTDDLKVFDVDVKVF